VESLVVEPTVAEALVVEPSLVEARAVEPPAVEAPVVEPTVVESLVVEPALVEARAVGPAGTVPDPSFATRASCPAPPPPRTARRDQRPGSLRMVLIIRIHRV
jgi:hypothetical protein